MSTKIKIHYFFSLILTFPVFIGAGCKEEKGEDPVWIIEEKEPEKLPNVLIILADDLTVKDLGCYGGTNVNTPNIDRLAREGMRFTSCYTSSAMCTPCRTSLYTGLYPVKNGAHKNGPGGVIKPGVESIAHHMQRKGYRVGLTGKKHINPISQFNFEIVPGFTANILGKTADYDTQELVPFMTRNANQPYCLVVASTLPHTPWTVGDREQFDESGFALHDNWFDSSDTRRRFRDYLAEVSELDKQVGDVLRLIEQLNQKKNTLVLFLGEQGSQFPGNKWTLWNPGIHSAMIARLPDSIRAGTVSDQLVQYEDVIPTVIDFINKNIPGELDGYSFADILKGHSSDEVRDYGFAVHSNNTEGYPYSIRAVFNKTHKLIWNLNYEVPYYNKYVVNSKEFVSWKAAADTSEVADFLVQRYENRPEFELYDMQDDPYELNNLAYEADYLGIRENLKAELDAWMESQGDPGSSLDQ
jgi:N-sulfoglucosamine sulfohydrolase